VVCGFFVVGFLLVARCLVVVIGVFWMFGDVLRVLGIVWRCLKVVIEYLL
jgi:hypothetical protein